MNCDETRPKLSAYLDGELRPGDRARVEEHLAGCRACAVERDGLGDAWDRVRDLATFAPASDLWPRLEERLGWQADRRGPAAWRRRPFAALAAAAGLAGLLAGLRAGELVMSPSEAQTSPVASAPDIPAVRYLGEVTPGTLSDAVWSAEGDAAFSGRDR